MRRRMTPDDWVSHSQTLKQIQDWETVPIWGFVKSRTFIDSLPNGTPFIFHATIVAMIWYSEKG